MEVWETWRIGRVAFLSFRSVCALGRRVSGAHDDSRYRLSSRSNRSGCYVRRRPTKAAACRFGSFVRLRKGTTAVSPPRQRSKDAAPSGTVVRRHLKPTVFLAVLGTILITLAVMNFMTGEKKIEQKISPLSGIDDPQFLRSMGSLLGPAIIGGNRVQELTNGDQIFPAMLSAIRGAHQSITFETYIYWSGTIGKEFTAALVERARAGVPVHVLLDWVGTGKIDEAYLDAMMQAGVQIERYHPLR